MNLKELIEKRKQLVATMQTKLGEASKALADGNHDVVKSLQDEAADYAAQVEGYTKQINALQNAAAAAAVEFESSEPAAEPAAEPAKPVAKAARLPFDDTPDEPETQDNFTKSVYLARFENDTDVVKGLIKDLYKSEENYQDLRISQQDAFVKYLRVGETRLDRNEERLLRHEIILRPQDILRDVKAGVDYRKIKATIAESTGELGGYLVPEDYRASLVQKIADTGIVRRYARKQTTSRDAIEWPVLLGGDDRYTSAVRVTWIEENPTDANKTLTNPTFGMQRIPVHTVMARVDVSKNQLEDSAFNVVSLITELFGEAAGIDEDIQFITGNGGNTPRGVLGVQNGNQASPLAGVESVVSGASSTITADGIFDLVYELPQQYRSGAVLLGSRTTHRDARKLKDTQNRYLWEASLQAGQPAMLAGYPIYESESVPAVAVNSYPIIFGDWSGYVIVDRVGMTVERVQDTTTTGQNKVALFMRRRLGGDVVEPWKFKVQKVSS